jgi:acetoin:2,6-dichlorophenolindophenol oxidoreductase subunit beta
VTEVDFRAAIGQALDEELGRDEAVAVFGVDASAGGLAGKHGSDRVFDTPLSDLALAGTAFGSAVGGLRPVVAIGSLALAIDTLVGQAAAYWYRSNEQAAVPLVVRAAIGASAPFEGAAGLKVVGPSTPGDAKALLKAAIRDDNPVLFLEHEELYATTGEVGDEVGVIGEAAVVRPGDDVTLVGAMRTVHQCLAAAEELAGEGIECEVIDVRTLHPADTATVLWSVERTNRLVVVEDGSRAGGWAAEVVADVAEQGLGDLDDLRRIAADGGEAIATMVREL